VKNIITLMCPESISVEYELLDNVLHINPTTFVMKQSSYAISSRHIVDLFNYIGKCVVSGGIRRTAELMLGDPEDEEFLSLKQDTNALYDRRWASNNSVVGRVGMDYTSIVEASMTNGEPGIVYLDNCRKFSRMGGRSDHKDSDVMGVNPCGEITLHNYELCTLVETFPANHENFEDYRKTLKYAYLYGKTVTLVPTHNTKTNAVMAKNRRIGCSMSGIVQAMEKFGRRSFLEEFCDSGYSYITELDKRYSHWLGVPISIKKTSVKPSGSVSLLTTATPGIHYAHSEYYIRNIRIQDTSPLLPILKIAGYPIEPDAYSKNTMVVSFPVHEKNFRKGKRDVSVWEQFANVADMQSYWSDNAVSATITVKPTEKEDYLAALQHFESKLKAVSVLPLNDSDHGYVQAPYIEITKEEYDSLADKIQPLSISSVNAHDKEDKFCDGDSCDIQ
jgi:adenosylcobalamin-dependent ribonucleoside-triphosphate reductase